MDKQIYKRIKFLRVELGITENSLAEMIGINQTTLNYQASRDDFSYNIIYALACKFPQVSMDWLITGEGDMFKAKHTNANEELVATLQETIRVYNQIIMKKN